jgi:hypothetical protein
MIYEVNEKIKHYDKYYDRGMKQVVTKITFGGRALIVFVRKSL